MSLSAVEWRMKHHQSTRLSYSGLDTSQNAMINYWIDTDAENIVGSQGRPGSPKMDWRLTCLVKSLFQSDVVQWRRCSNERIIETIGEDWWLVSTVLVDRERRNTVAVTHTPGMKALCSPITSYRHIRLDLCSVVISCRISLSSRRWRPHPAPESTVKLRDLWSFIMGCGTPWLWHGLWLFTEVRCLVIYP